MLAEGRVLDAGFEAPLHQQLEDAPGLEARGIAQKEVPRVGGLLQKLHKEAGGVVPFLLEGGFPLAESAPALRVVGGLGVPGHPLNEGPRQVMEPRTAVEAQAQVPQERPVPVVERQHEFLQDVVIRVDLHAAPPSAAAGSSR
jgi:hypothetical protein